jgi:hypothetical protein
MPDQIIDALMALSLDDDARRAHPLAAWVVMEKQPGYAGKLIARLVAETPTAYVLVAGSLSELRAQIPPGLERSPRQIGDPLGLVETWFFADRVRREPSRRA